MQQMMMEIQKLKKGQGGQEPQENQRNAKMKGKMDENFQYKHN